MRKVSAAVLCALSTGCVSTAQLPVKKGYVGISATGLTGTGVERAHFEAAGADVFSGFRISRWVSAEGFFATHFAAPSEDSGGGAMCSGTSAETWRWETFGARLWVHLLHLDRVDLSIAPTVGFGLSVRHVSSALLPGQTCYFPGTSTGNFGWPSMAVSPSVSR